MNTSHLIGGLVLFSVLGSANAAIYDFEFKGSIDYSDFGNNDPYITLPQTFSLDGLVDSVTGVVSASQFTIDGSTGTFAGGGFSYTNNVPGLGDVVHANIHYKFADFDNIETAFLLNFTDPGGSIVSDAGELNAGALSPSMADIMWIGISGSPVAEYWEWDGTINQVSMNAVPTPSAVWLFVSGMFGLTGMSWRMKST